MKKYIFEVDNNPIATKGLQIQSEHIVRHDLVHEHYHIGLSSVTWGLHKPTHTHRYIHTYIQTHTHKNKHTHLQKHRWKQVHTLIYTNLKTHIQFILHSFI